MTAPTPPMRADRGGASTELVLAAPVVVLVLLLAVQAALAWHAQHLAQTAATRGLAAARAHDGTPAAGTHAARALLDQTAGRVLHVTSVQATRTASQARVTVRGRVLPVLPGLHLAVDGHAAGPVERFVTTAR